MASPEDKVNDACSSGDVATLQALFTELNVQPNHDSLPSNQRPPIGSVSSMLFLAASGGNISTVKYLFSYFPDLHVESFTLIQVMDKGHVEMLKELCIHDPNAAKLQHGENTLLAHACGSVKNPAMVKVLLDAGADPNEQPSHMLPRTDQYIVWHDLPASTMEQFFDAGYKMEDGGPMSDAIEKGRVDIVEVLYRRGRELPDPILPSARELMRAAKGTKANRQEMMDLARRLFPEEYGEKKGFLGGVMKKLHS
jgi:hypothetical protein